MANKTITSVTLSSISTDTGTSGDRITSDTTLSFSISWVVGGNGAATTYYAYLVNNVSGTATAFPGSVTTGATSATLDLTGTTLSAGTYYVVLQTTNTYVAGTGLSDTTNLVTVDTSAPAAGTLALSGFTDSGSNGTDGISTDDVFGLSLTGAEGGANVVYQVSTDGGSTWNTTVATSASHADGSYKYRALVTDTAGNSATSNVVSVTVDKTAPTAGTLALSGFTDTGNSSSDGFSTDDTFGLSLSGAEGGATVAYEVSTDNGATWGSTTATSSTHADGAYQYRAVVTDVAGNSATSNVVSVTVDKTAPAAGTLALSGFSDSGDSDSDGLSNDDVFGLSLSGAEGGAIVVYEVSTDGGSTWNTTTAASASHADGSYQFRAVVTDAAGNSATSNVVSVTVDKTAPAAGTLALSGFTDTGSADGVTSNGTFGLSLTGAGAGTVVYQVSTDGGTSWSDTSATSTSHAEGAYDYRAVVTDSAGNSATSNVVSVTVDTTNPDAGTLSLSGFADSGDSDSDGLSNDADFGLSLDGAEDGASVAYEVSTDGGSTWGAASDASDSHADGEYQYRAVVTDAAGNSATSNVVSVTVDTTDPDAGTLSLSGFADSGDSDSDGLSNDADFGLSLDGAEDGASVAYEVSTDGGSTWGATTDTSDSHADGEYQYRAVVTDAAGNSATSNVVSVTVDTTNPDAGTLSLSGFADSGDSDSDGLSNDADFGLSLDGAEDGASVAYEVSTDGGSTWGAATDTSDSHADGEYQYRAVVTDAAGNSATSNVVSVTVDTTDPDAGTLSLSGFADSGDSDSDGLSNDAEFGLSLDGAEDGASVAYEVSTDGGSTWGAATDTSDSHADGEYQYRAVVTDAAGNSATSNVVSVTVDTTNPDAGTLSLSGFADTGDSDSDGVSSDADFGLSLDGAEDGASVAYEVSTDGGSTWGAASDASDSHADGEYQYRAVVTDAAGNSATSNVVSVTVDTTNPDAGTLSLSGFTDSGDSDSDGLSNDAEFGLSLDGAEDGASVAYEVSTDGGSTWGAASDASDGHADGEYQYRAVVTDAAGNSATSNVVSVTVDTTNPDAGTLSLSGFADSGDSDSDGLSNDAEFGLSLDGAEDGASVAYEVSTDGGSTWGAASDASDSHADGEYQYRAVVTDAAGNSATSNVVSVTVDTTNPDAGTLSLSGFTDSGDSDSDGLSNDADFGLSLDGAEDGASVAYEVSTDGGSTWGAASEASDSHADGEYQYRAVVTDAAGNSATSNVVSVTVDTTNPDAGTLSLSGFTDTGANGSDGVSSDANFGLSLSGAEGGATVVYEVSTDGGNNWSETSGAADIHTDGDYQYRAVVTDAAGNGATSNVVSVTVDTTDPAAGTLSLSGFTDTGANGSDGVSSDATFGLSLSGAESGASVVYQVSTNGGSTWANVSAASASHADGSYSYRAVVTDAAGNDAISNVVNVTVDTTLPAPRLTLQKVATDDIVNMAELARVVPIRGTASGDAAAGDAVTVRVNGVTYTGTLGADLKFSVNVNPSDIALDTRVQVSLTNVDAAGNSKTVTAERSYTIDTTTSVLINGTTGNDSLTGGSGNDTLAGLDGDDTLNGGTGADALQGGFGNDTFIVDNLGDTVTDSGAGTDIVMSGVTFSLAASATVEQLVLTGTGNTNATGNALANTLTGNSGNNALDGGSGADTMAGGVGDDSYYVDSIADVVQERFSQGTDTVYSSVNTVLSIHVENLSLTGVRNATGTGNTGDNTITGNTGDNALYGLSGNDNLSGDAGADTLYGGNGNDSLDGGAGADLMRGHAGDDTYQVDNAGDLVVEAAAGGHDVVHSTVSFSAGVQEIEEIFLFGGNLDATGSAYANALVGTAGNNRLDGGKGADTLTGGEGNDTYVIDNAGDVIVELTGQGTDTVESSLNYTLGADLENLVLRGTAGSGNGNELGNSITGNQWDNRLDGKAGADTLSGGGGADRLFGGTGNDTLIGGTDDDYLQGDSGADTYVFGANSGHDQVVGFSSAGGDKLMLTSGLNGSAIVSAATALAAASVVGADTLIRLGAGNTITVVGVTTLHLSDFIIA